MEEIEDPTKYGHDIEAYINTKGVLSIERIKDIVGEIMSSCQIEMEYPIIEYIMKNVIFEKKCLRESFMQEVLNSAGVANYRITIQDYLNENLISV